MKKASLLLSLLFIPLLCSYGQDITLSEIIEKHKKAMGNLKDSVTSSVLRRSINYSGLDFSQSSYTKYPDKEKTVTIMKGVYYIKAFDGKNGWEKTGDYPAKKLNSYEIKQGKNIFRHLKIFNKNKNTSFMLMGKDYIDGILCFKIRLTKNNIQQPQNFYISSKNFLITKIDGFNKQGLKVSCTYADYRRINGQMFPFKLIGLIANQPVISTVISIEYNIKLDDKFFEFPKK